MIKLTDEDRKELERLKHISDTEIYKDIRDTQDEIANYEEEILKRKSFIAKLRHLLNMRNIERLEEKEKLKIE